MMQVCALLLASALTEAPECWNAKAIAVAWLLLTYVAVAHPDAACYPPPLPPPPPQASRSSGHMVASPLKHSLQLLPFLQR